MVERGGFEPPKAEPADLQSAPFDRSGTSPLRGHDVMECPLAYLFAAHLEPAKGIEPPTH
jgi:hypothetical protein